MVQISLREILSKIFNGMKWVGRKTFNIVKLFLKLFVNYEKAQFAKWDKEFEEEEKKKGGKDA